MSCVLKFWAFVFGKMGEWRSEKVLVLMVLMWVVCRRDYERKRKFMGKNVILIKLLLGLSFSNVNSDRRRV